MFTEAVVLLQRLTCSDVIYKGRQYQQTKSQSGILKHYASCYTILKRRIKHSLCEKDGYKMQPDWSYSCPRDSSRCQRRVPALQPFVTQAWLYVHVTAGHSKIIE